LSDGCSIGRRSSALADHRIRISEPEQIERAQDVAFVFWAASGRIEIVDAQQAGPVGRVEPTADGCEQGSEMQGSRGSWSESTDVGSRQTQR
ncbi:MAG: hypothetical protein RL412_1529, partial [Pseudomonadota bacterium]